MYQTENKHYLSGIFLKTGLCILNSPRSLKTKFHILLEPKQCDHSKTYFVVQNLLHFDHLTFAFLRQKTAPFGDVLSAISGVGKIESTLCTLEKMSRTPLPAPLEGEALSL